MTNTITVKSHFGQYYEVDKSELPSILKRGFSVPSNEEIDEHNNRIEYGGGLNPLIAGAEEAASTATFGGSRLLENALGVTTPEAQEARAHYNPMSHLAGIPVGVVADPFGLVGLAGKAGKAAQAGARVAIKEAPVGASLAAKALRNMPVAAAGAATEGALFGLGQTASDQAMGHLNDPDTMAEHIAGNVGYGALFAGVLGAGFEGGANLLGRSTLAKAAAYQGAINSGVLSSEDAAAQKAAKESLGLGAEPPFSDFKAPPSSLGDIQKAVKEHFPIVPEEMPSGNLLRESVNDLPDLQFKPHALQYESLADQGLRDYYKTFLEGQGEESKALRSYEALQKQEAATKLDNTIQDLAPNHKVSDDFVSGGERAIKSFSEQYEAEKEKLLPIFKKIDEISDVKKTTALDSLAKIKEKLGDAVDKVIDFDKKGVAKIRPYKPTMALTEEAYKSLKDVVGAINDKQLTLSELRNLRDSMKRHIDFTSGRASEATAQVSQIRSALMDQMQESVGKVSSDLEVREVFKRYAQNEEKRGVIEKILGGSLSDKAAFQKKIKTEDVLNRIFSSSVSVDAAKGILGDEFSKVLADYLASNRSKVTDEARIGFSSNKFKTFLNNKNPELAAAFSDPTKLKRLHSLSDYMRILPDSPSINPSGTAKTLSIMEKIAGLSKSLRPTEAIMDFANKYMGKIEAEKQRFTIDQVLAGKHFAAAEKSAEEMQYMTSKVKKLERFAENTAYRIKSAAAAVFKKGAEISEKSAGILGSRLVPEPQKKIKRNDGEAALDSHHKFFAHIDDLFNNPEKMMNSLEDMTAGIYLHDPALSSSLQAFSAKATSFLASKLPPKLPPALNNIQYKASSQEISKFERYYSIVENPILALKEVKNKTIAPETIETLSAVYPKIYDVMKASLLERASEQKSIPYQTRQAISFFIGQPLEGSLQPQSILTNQSILVSAPRPDQGVQMKPRAKGLDNLERADRAGADYGAMSDKV